MRETGESAEFDVPHESSDEQPSRVSRRERLFGSDASGSAEGEARTGDSRTVGRTSNEVAKPTEADEAHESERLPRRFRTDDEARAYGSEQWGETLASLPDEQVGAVQRYARQLEQADRGAGPDAIDYREINGALRRGTGFTPEIRRDIEEIDAALERHRTTESLVVTRATGIDHWDFDPADATGMTLTEDSFTSTSLGGVADAFKGEQLILELEVPAGTPALYLGNEVSEYSRSERELLLGRGLKWQVLSIRPGEIAGQWRATGRVVR